MPLRGLSALSFLELERQSWDSVTLGNAQRGLLWSVCKTDKNQDVGEVLQMSYLAVFIIAVSICFKLCLVSLKDFLAFNH